MHWIRQKYHNVSGGHILKQIFKTQSVADTLHRAEWLESGMFCVGMVEDAVNVTQYRHSPMMAVTLGPQQTVSSPTSGIRVDSSKAPKAPPFHPL